MSNNKRKQNYMDPNRINNYNKFLSTLDNKPKIDTLEKNTIDILLSKFSNNLLNNDISNNNIPEKSNIDNFLNKVNNKFYENNYFSENFSGSNIDDKCCPDPNYYRDLINNSSNSSNSDKMLFYLDPIIMGINPTTKPEKWLRKNKESELSIKKPENISVEIKETITINTEINNISDILKLIDTYKYDPAIKYNINMKSLHDIKEPLIELNNMIGMTTLKTNIVDQILYFSQDLHKGAGDFMHTVIYGPPGTGKTEAAKIMGKIYSKLGILNKETFTKVTRSDLIAGYLGQTALKTQDVIKKSIGGVLFIDEAYALGCSEKKDSFAKECIDTLCEALSDNKDNLMVIIAGYEKELKDCFFSINQGLDSRFTWRFKTDDYSGEDLYKIFLKKIKDINWEVNDESKISVDWFIKNKDYFKFYGRDIELLLSKCKLAHSRRVFCCPESEKKKLVFRDLEKGFEIYLKNDSVKERKNDTETKKMIYNSLYS
jgi:SpoVK/Ycf46/Vps4 family AAA+-type ATPase